MTGATPGIGIAAEKPAVVVDFGRRFTKLGIAGEPRPRHIIQTPELFYAPWVVEREILSSSSTTTSTSVILSSGVEDHVVAGAGTMEVNKKRVINTKEEEDNFDFENAPSTVVTTGLATAARTLRDWVFILDPLLHRIYFLYLKCSPKERKFFLCEAAFLPTTFKRALAYLFTYLV